MSEEDEQGRGRGNLIDNRPQEHWDKSHRRPSDQEMLSSPLLPRRNWSTQETMA